MRKVINLAALTLIILIMSSCASQNTQVTRLSNDEVPDLSGRWNANDSRDVSQQMIMSMLSSAWLSNFRSEEERVPRIILGNIENRSDEHIETGLFVKDIEREITNSGKAKFVSSKDERKEIREERHNQQSYASDETVKALANEAAADFMLIGSIKSLRDVIDNQQVITYQVDLELINIETNEKVWLETMPKNKMIYRKKVKF
ncbi:MAG: penicillin-binding protein activator LpoB [Candidatus Cloacimonetes bacterium]|nr:penicillin-binding protein activator LpoB [Candidatus Cloacimonadota bacterium]